MDKDKLIAKYNSKLDDLIDIKDSEKAHAEADKLLCELLKELDFGSVVALYDLVTKWYS